MRRCGGVLCLCVGYFNPRTHVGCDFQRTVCMSLSPYFNPRTHVGCDPLIFTIVLYISNFNPRTHVGCDGSKYGSPQGVGISIHAPTWGATYRIAFNKTLLEFQSTHPRGVRLDSQFVTLQRRYFNPRTHVGCDIVGSQVVRATRISIHAPTWGATLGSIAPYICTPISIHAPTWGATCER